MNTITSFFTSIVIFFSGLFGGVSDTKPAVVNPPIVMSEADLVKGGSLEDIESVISTRMNSDGFIKGEKFIGTGDATQQETRALLKKSTFLSSYFNKTVPYAVMQDTSSSGASGSSWRVIVQPEQKVTGSDISYEFNRVDNFNPWNAGSDITGGVDQSDYELLNDSELIVTYKVSKDVAFPNVVNKCIKLGNYKATLKLVTVKNQFMFTDKKEKLIEATCTNQRAG
jgi:hypothetical protein